MTLEWLMGWWNVIYLLPFGLALTYLFAYAASGWTFGDADGGADAEADADMDADADVHVDADIHPDLGDTLDPDLHPDIAGGHPGADLVHGAGAGAPDIDADTDLTASKGILQAVTWLGVGRVPLSILLMILLMSFGVIGFVVNQAAREWLGETALVALLSLPLAIGGSLGITSLVGQSLARWLPMTETSARHRRELVGLRATSVFQVDERHGVAMVRDPGGDRYQVACRTLPGRAAIAGGTEVVLVKYSAGAGVFYCVPSGLLDQAAASRQGEAAPPDRVSA